MGIALLVIVLIVTFILTALARSHDPLDVEMQDLEGPRPPHDRP